MKKIIKNVRTKSIIAQKIFDSIRDDYLFLCKGDNIESVDRYLNEYNLNVWFNVDPKGRFSENPIYITNIKPTNIKYGKTNSYFLGSVNDLFHIFPRLKDYIDSDENDFGKIYQSVFVKKMDRLIELVNSQIELVNI